MEPLYSYVNMLTFRIFSTFAFCVVPFVAIDGRGCEGEVNWCLQSIKTVFEVVKSVTLSSTVEKV